MRDTNIQRLLLPKFITFKFMISHVHIFSGFKYWFFYYGEYLYMNKDFYMDSDFYMDNERDLNQTVI